MLINQIILLASPYPERDAATGVCGDGRVQGISETTPVCTGEVEAEGAVIDCDYSPRQRKQLVQWLGQIS